MSSAPGCFSPVLQLIVVPFGALVASDGCSVGVISYREDYRVVPVVDDGVCAQAGGSL